MTATAAAPTARPAAVIDLRGLWTIVPSPHGERVVHEALQLRVDAGEIVALVGQSGSGKSTLLHIAGLLEQPDEGEVVVDGNAAGRLGDRGRTTLRRRFLRLRSSRRA